MLSFYSHRMDHQYLIKQHEGISANSLTYQYLIKQHEGISANSLTYCCSVISDVIHV